MPENRDKITFLLRTIQKKKSLESALGASDPPLVGIFKETPTLRLREAQVQLEG